ncbi:uncharacterized protein LOC115442510 [Manduca sexta]|uniref:Ig-like domain-containing protein n=1 Tax=Manduca sexta TaxID=7130 RepID=A0A922CJL2_MANSE|nr:uncharacterized protein LOC115442510 [Manduca sexta]XP_030023414.1 uncharacterized protein LOC115442510 [Manduca sexta]XP_030023415.1 uncharacterized protein LOC115442510 [Manduca sexta]KAG6448551.1 hypothetical protein O3G_MSEX005585 [Manduca sexta]KAG6448552.1 hypothetical protein O3G_MSEX005585 [Manduca sexta]
MFMGQRIAGGMELCPWPGSRIFVAFFATVFWGMGVRGLHNLEINVPNAVLVGETVTLECSWQLEDEEALYSVKWYRGREEFYRYIPKELPHTRVFPLPGIEVDISRSGARRVVLQQATPAMAGRFRCEVSADAPTFHTELRSAPLEVVEPPEWGPKLVSDRSWYGVGSTLRATCASPSSHPAANLTFALNGQEIEMDDVVHKLPAWFKWDPPPKMETTTTDLPDSEFNFFHEDSNIQYLDESYINLHKEEIRRPQKESLKPTYERTEPDNRLPSVGEVSFVVRNEAFERGSLRLTCIASIYNLYAARSELIFDMEQPEVASVLGVRNSSVGSSPCKICRITAFLVLLSYRIR